jgi:hypothetical protein
MLQYDHFRVFNVAFNRSLVAGNFSLGKSLPALRINAFKIVVGFVQTQSRLNCTHCRQLEERL